MALLHKLAIFVCFSLLTSSIAANSQSLDNDLICHSTVDSECYPRIFVPTKEFRIVHDDQEIPKGLHVRLDVQTGKKMAKIYDPSEGDDAVNAVAVLPEGTEAGNDQIGGLDPNSQKTVREMHKVLAEGAVKPPAGSGADATGFEANVATLKKLYKGRKMSKEQSQLAQNAFEELEELCHDIYWGRRLVQDAELLDRMYSSLSSYENKNNAASGSATLLSVALQNNQGALEVFSDFLKSRGGQARFMNSLAAVYKRQDVAMKARYTSLISKLIARDDLLAAFVSGDGLKGLSQTLDSQHQKSRSTQGIESFDINEARLRRRASDLAADHIIAAEDANQKFRSIHEKRSSAGTVAVPEVLRRALANRAEWCEVLNTAYSIWAGKAEMEKTELIEKTRWDYVPVTCDSTKYDLKTGKALRGARVNHDEL